MATLTMPIVCSARMRRMQLANRVYGYGNPWKMLFARVSGKLGVASDDLPPKVTAARMECSPL